MALHDRSKEMVILCYGDSNTYGYDPDDGGRYPKDRRWTNILQKKLGEKFTVISEGLNGRTTAFDRIGAPWKNGLTHFLPIAASHRPVDILIFMLGTNDSIAELGLTPEQICGGMQRLAVYARDMMNEIQGYEPQILIISPVPVTLSSEDESENDWTCASRSAALPALYAQLAKENGFCFLEAGTVAELSPIDGMHLSEQGHKALAEVIHRKVSEISGKADS